MDQFEIGDKIIYPNQGIGIIEDIQEENLYGVNSKIYHVRIVSNNTLVLVPSCNAQEIGLRKPSSKDSIQDIFEFMKNGDIEVTMNWKGRYKEHVELMKSGSLLDMASVLKSLYYLSLIKPLSFREKKMMEKAKNLIVSEISEVSSISWKEVEKKLLETLANCFKEVKPGLDS